MSEYILLHVEHVSLYVISVNFCVIYVYVWEDCDFVCVYVSVCCLCVAFVIELSDFYSFEADVRSPLAVEWLLLADVSPLRADACPARIHAVAHGPSALHRRVGAVRRTGEHEAHQPRSTIFEVVHSALCEESESGIQCWASVRHRSVSVLRFNTGLEACSVFTTYLFVVAGGYLRFEHELRINNLRQTGPLFVESAKL